MHNKYENALITVLKKVGLIACVHSALTCTKLLLNKRVMLSFKKRACFEVLIILLKATLDKMLTPEKAKELKENQNILNTINPVQIPQTEQKKETEVEGQDSEHHLHHSFLDSTQKALLQKQALADRAVV